MRRGAVIPDVEAGGEERTRGTLSINIHSDDAPGAASSHARISGAGVAPKRRSAEYIAAAEQVNAPTLIPASAKRAA